MVNAGDSAIEERFIVELVNTSMVLDGLPTATQNGYVPGEVSFLSLYGLRWIDTQQLRASIARTPEAGGARHPLDTGDTNERDIRSRWRWVEAEDLSVCSQRIVG